MKKYWPITLLTFGAYGLSLALTGLVGITAANVEPGGITTALTAATVNAQNTEFAPNPAAQGDSRDDEPRVLTLQPRLKPASWVPLPGASSGQRIGEVRMLPVAAAENGSQRFELRPLDYQYQSSQQLPAPEAPAKGKVYRF